MKDHGVFEMMCCRDYDSAFNGTAHPIFNEVNYRLAKTVIK
jgi:hypothetical protein